MDNSEPPERRKALAGTRSGRRQGPCRRRTWKPRQLAEVDFEDDDVDEDVEEDDDEEEDDEDDEELEAPAELEPDPPEDGAAVVEDEEDPTELVEEERLSVR
ncbi:hypothetical protein ABH930_003235 [Kitasatospora sp. GAS204A]|nr:hypothetical protein [Kitasatospora sp. GAS204B]